MENLGAAYAAFSVVAVIFGIVLLICWIVLPFALIGTKPLLRQLISEQRKTNELLELRRGAPRAETEVTQRR